VNQVPHLTDLAPRALPTWLRLVHGWIILNLVAQQLYAGWQVFFVLQPEGTLGPMFNAARSLPPDVMLARRLYAIEGWIAFVGLALYLALTEVLPRRLRNIG
jgi:hypothetical protein